MRELMPGVWVGNAGDAGDAANLLTAGVEAIVDLALEELPASPPRELMYCRIPIVDGAGNSASRIRLAVRLIRDLIKSPTPTLVTCSAGISRSPAIVAAAMATINDSAFNEELRQIAESGPCDVSTGLVADILTALKDVQ